MATYVERRDPSLRVSSLLPLSDRSIELLLCFLFSTPGIITLIVAGSGLFTLGNLEVFRFKLAHGACVLVLLFVHSAREREGYCVGTIRRHLRFLCY